MSKYEPLQAYLAAQTARELPMTFQDVERLLSFTLPASARSRPQWWSNKLGSHVAVKAWRGAGWRTSRVDVGGERVVFVREEAVRTSRGPRQGAKPTITGARLQDRHWRLLTRIAEDTGVDLEGALADALDLACREQRRQTLEWFAANSTKVDNPSDSADLIREDRDRDDR